EKTEEVLLHVLESSLKLLHPFMPFVTEAVWQNISERQSIMGEAWPRPERALIKSDAEESAEIIKSIIVSIRNIRADMNIPHSKRLVVYLMPLRKASEAKLKGGIDYIKNLARLEELVIDKNIKKPGSCATAVLEDFNIFIPLKGVIDIEVERSRLTKKMQETEAQLKFSDKRLKDKKFAARAPEVIVNQEKDKAKKLSEQIERLKSTIGTLL
ncbi:unnamed protein product, partial [marine sediment metagenome]